MEVSEQNKMGSKPILPLLMTMSLPAMLSMFIQSMYNIVDSMFVARISEDALTAVSLAFPIQNFILAVAVGTGVGCNSLISRKLGERKQEDADSTVTHGLILSVITSIVFIILGLILIPPFFRLFTDSPNVFQLGCDYTYIVTLLAFGIFIHITVEKVFQSTGSMIYPMLYQALGAITNIILDPIMIFGLFGFPAMGVKGAAIATIIGQLLSMGLSLHTLIAKEHSVKIKIKGFQFDKEIIKGIYGVGFPSIVMQSMGSFLVMGLNGILIHFSNAAVATFGVYFKLQSFVFMPVSGLIQGAMPIMGYNYGAGNSKRLNDTLKLSLLFAIGMMGVGTLVFVLYKTELLLLFKATDEMLNIGNIALPIISSSFISAAFGFIFATYFQSIGKGFYSLIISLLRQLIIILPLAYIFSIKIGLIGIWITFPIAETVTAIVAVIMYYYNEKNNECVEIVFII